MCGCPKDSYDAYGLHRKTAFQTVKKYSWHLSSSRTNEGRKRPTCFDAIVLAPEITPGMHCIFHQLATIYLKTAGEYVLIKTDLENIC